MMNRAPSTGAGHARRLIPHALCVWALLSAAANAAEVTLRHRGVTLNAELELAAGKTLADGVLLITHGALAHRDMEIVTALRSGLQQKGHSTLAINLSLGLDRRHGMYDCTVTHRHRNADAAEEIGLWVDWLTRQGAQRIALLGHSRGGAQTALYAAQHPAASVKAVVLMAPATRENSDAAEYQRRFGKPLAPVLAQARKYVAAGKGDAVLRRVGLLSCADAWVTAGTFVSYYGEPQQVDAPALIPRVGKPTLVIVAGSDEVVIGLDRKIAPLVNGERLQMKVIDGADHFFRDLYADESVDAIDAFLKRAGEVRGRRAGGF